MKAKVLTILLAIAAHNAVAEDCHFYLKQESGLAIHKKFGSDDYTSKPNKGGSFGIGIGKHFTDNITLELMLHHKDLSYSETVGNTNYAQKIRANPVFLNVIYHTFYQYGITHFVTMGIGASHNHAGTYRASGDINGMRLSKSQTDVAFNMGTGFKAKVNNNITISVHYKYFHLGKAKTSVFGMVDKFGAIGSPVVAKLRNHAILFGTTYQF
jgi:opacity protein-like surface antigen